MFNRFKSALYNVVGNFDPTEGGTVGNLGTTVKFPYTRPHFLQLNSEDEILVTADHALRPIICPRDISRLPWNSGYAETINAGKSKRNEDQAAIHVGLLTRTVKRSSINHSTVKYSRSKSKEQKKGNSSINGIVLNKDLNGIDSVKPIPGEEAIPSNVNGTDHNSHNNIDAHPEIAKGNLEKEDASHHTVSIPYYYFGVFDGHAGWGAAVSAANQLHHIIHEKLCDVIELIIPDESDSSNLCGPLWSSEKMVSPEGAIIGALEQAFWTMDHQIGMDRQTHYLSGGCTACVSLFILGKVFVSNAGDSRGVIGYKANPVPMSFDFTPETESQRIRKLGARHPELLGGEFTHLEFLRRPLRSDVGKKAPYRDHFMKGWSLKTISEADLKYPLVCGEGKRSRVLATIGVTRGFGDHDLKAQFSSLPIKPFLSPEPEVRVFDLKEHNVSEEDILILGTDGLWDIISNEQAVKIVCCSLQQFSLEDPNRYKYRYTSAAHDLVLYSRGRLREHQWRTSADKHATIDDISAFVIPLKTFKEEFEQWETDLHAQCKEIPIDPSEEVVVPSEVVSSVANEAVLVQARSQPNTEQNSRSTSLSGATNPSDSLQTISLGSTKSSEMISKNSSENFEVKQTSSVDSSVMTANAASTDSKSESKSNNEERILHNNLSNSDAVSIESTAIVTSTASDATNNSLININSEENSSSTIISNEDNS